MSSPLNPILYRRLKEHFGSVKISQQGIAQKHRAYTDISGEKKLDFIVDGEYYSVCCFACGDTRHRLAINHMFGKRDEHGRRMNFLAVCFNEDCMSIHEHRQTLMEAIDGLSLANVDVRKGADRAIAHEVKLPGSCKRLDELSPRHKANVYLADRGFDPVKLAEHFGVLYCEESHFFLAANRIIIPIEHRGKLVGWQARYIGELPWKDRSQRKALPPKYFSCPGSNFRSTTLYNWAQMKLWQTGIVCEGPTDVWRFGRMAGCIFGNVVTAAQRNMLAALFNDNKVKRSLILLLDPEEFESEATEELVADMRGRMAARFCAVKLPDGTDPGSLDREFLREYVREEAAKQGTTVVYKKVGVRA